MGKTNMLHCYGIKKSHQRKQTDSVEKNLNKHLHSWTMSQSLNEKLRTIKQKEKCVKDKYNKISKKKRSYWLQIAHPLSFTHFQCTKINASTSWKSSMLGNDIEITIFHECRSPKQTKMLMFPPNTVVIENNHVAFGNTKRLTTVTFLSKYNRFHLTRFIDVSCILWFRRNIRFWSWNSCNIKSSFIFEQSQVNNPIWEDAVFRFISRWYISF